MGKLIERSFQVFGNFGSNHIGVGQIGGVFQTFVPQPEDVQVHLVAFEQVLVSEGLESFRFLPVVPILGVIAGYKIIQMVTLDFFPKGGFVSTIS